HGARANYRIRARFDREDIDAGFCRPRQSAVTLRRMRNLFLLAAVVMAAAAPTVAAPGSGSASHLVGFRVIERLDTARTSPQFPRGRPIQIAFWYPSASASPQLTYRDYYVLSARDASFSPSNTASEEQALGQYRAFLASASVPTPEADALLATRMHAARDAAPIPGRAPLVLIAQGNDHSAHDQAFLAEHLASRGFAVATVPSQARIGGRMKSEQEIPAQALDQAADLAFALSAARAEPNVRGGRYGIVGHSFGARSALLLAMRDTDAGALVSLDGGIGGAAGKGALETARGYDREAAALPILHLYEVGDRYMVSDLAPIRALARSNRWLMRVDDMRHVHFSSLGVLAASGTTLGSVTDADAWTRTAWDAVAAATASFLERFVISPPAGAKARTWAPPASRPLHTAEFLGRR
ncbi:MAG: hypothetical protein M3S32_02000, partial [Acidobacteriota bacterium]|nr:hypothetical protein [Acidobacteriota bacterium]